MIKSRVRQRGFVLVLVVIVLLGLALTALMLSRSASMGIALLSEQAAHDTLEYVTESGRAHALWKLAQNTTCSDYSSVPVTAFGQHSYAAAISPTSGSPVTITTTGIHADGTSRVRVTADARAYQPSVTVVLQPGPTDAQDTYIDESQPNWNFGNANSMHAGDFGSSAVAVSLLRFDLSDVAPDVHVISAALELRQVAAGTTPGPIGVRRLTNGWVQGSDKGSPAGAAADGATWNDSAPGVPWTTLGGDLDPRSFGNTQITGPGLFLWDVTQLVSGWVAGDFANHGLALVHEAPSVHGQFASSDHPQLDFHPKLTITYGCECGVVCASTGTATGYTEAYTAFSATISGTWQTVGLNTFGVPPNAVVEVALVNADESNQIWGGVRAVGSTLGRYVELHEAESGGTDIVVVHVQADAGGAIEVLTGNRTSLTFLLLGYWQGGAYQEMAVPLSIGSSGSWITRSLGAYGVPPGSVVEVLAVNDASEDKNKAGVRGGASSDNRFFEIHEAESGGIDGLTFLANADASSRIQLYAEDDGDVEFYLIGYWSDPPGTYIEAAIPFGKPGISATWSQTDVDVFGVPVESVASVVMFNAQSDSEAALGVRAVDSSLPRLLNLHEAEGGGNDLAGVQVNVDANGRMEWYDENMQSHEFWVVGWWLLP